MKWNKEYLKYALAIILFVVSSLVLALIIPKASQIRVSLSKRMLTQSQKTDDVNKKIALLIEANMLDPNDETRLELAITSDKNGNVDIARKALRDINDPGKLIKWPLEGKPSGVERINLVYQKLKPTYPQAASRFIRNFSNELQNNRDGLLTLSEDYFITGDYSEAERFALQGRGLDKYYPQTYEQLIKISTKLNKTDNANTYKKFLESITW